LIEAGNRERETREQGTGNREQKPPAERHLFAGARILEAVDLTVLTGIWAELVGVAFQLIQAAVTLVPGFLERRSSKRSR
jgi:hypothetical protein